jgi:hypothetical protein
MEYALVSGIVSNLHITKGYEDLAFTARDKSVVGLAAIAAASTGNSASSAILANSSAGAEVDMEFFTCFVDELPVKGRFHRVDFKEGEKIEFVISMKKGVGEVCGARDPVQRFIWTLPYQTRGHIAQKKSDILSSLTISGICSILFSILTFYDNMDQLTEEWPYMLNVTLLTFLITVFVNFMARRPFYKFSFEATHVFSTFGFEDPGMLNLPKRHIRADKTYCKETGEPRSWDKPWRYRYESTLVGKKTDPLAAEPIREEANQ